MYPKKRHRHSPHPPSVPHSAVYSNQDTRVAKMSWTDEWIRKERDSGILAIKKNKIRPFSATWMDPEMIILNKANHHVISLKGGIKNSFHMN